MNKKLYLDWINSLPKEHGLLAELQSSSRKVLSIGNIPNKRDENWRTTDLKKIEEIFNLPINQKEKQKNNENSHEINKEIFGITFQSEKSILQTNVQEMSLDEIHQHLRHNASSKKYHSSFVRKLNHATNENIIGFKIKGKEKISLEINISNTKNELIPSTIIIEVEEGSSLEISQIIEGSLSSAHIHLIDIEIKQNAKVLHGIIAKGTNSSKLLASISVNQSENSTYSLNSFQESWSLSRIEQHINQPQGKAETVLRGLQISNKDNELATFSLIHFDGPDGSLQQLHKSIAGDKSHSIFKGLIEVPQIAQQTEASQLSKNLLISSKAKIDTSPQMKIIADNVKCNHGATISQLEKEELFYLQSRGLDKEQANSLIINGFCKDIIKCIPFNRQKWSYLSKHLDFD